MPDQVVIIPVTQDEIDKNCGCEGVYQNMDTLDLLRVWLLKQLCPGETPIELTGVTPPVPH